MEHSHSRQYEARKIRRPGNRKSKLVDNFNIFIYVLIRHPGLLLTGLFTILIGITALALYSLGDVGSKDKVEPPEIPAVVAKPMTRPSENNNPTPLWMIAAIALSCASGCLMILRLVNHQVSTADKPITSPRAKSRTLNSSPIVAPLEPRLRKSDTPETVIPSEDMHPLDKRQEILAELMDIRQKNSWSAILLSKSQPGS